MPRDKVPRESVKLRRWILLVTVLILCLVFDLWLFWLSGRMGRLSFIGAKFFGTLCIVVAGGLGVLPFRFSRPQMTSALALVIVSLLFQVAWKPIDTKIYMAGEQVRMEQGACHEPDRGRPRPQQPRTASHGNNRRVRDRAGVLRPGTGAVRSFWGFRREFARGIVAWRRGQG